MKRTTLLLMLLLVWLSTAGTTGAFATADVQLNSLNWDYRFLAPSQDVGASLRTVSGADDGWQPLQEFGPAPGWNGSDELWMRVRIPDLTGIRDVEPVLYISVVDQVAQAFYNGDIIAEHGGFGPSGSPRFVGYPPFSVPLRSVRSNDFVFFRIASSHNVTGFSGDVLLGSKSRIVREVFGKDILPLVSSGMMALIGVFMLVAFLQQRRDWATLGYALFSVALGVYVASVSSFFKSVFSDDRVRFHVEIFSAYLSATALSFYADQLFSSVDRWRMMRASWIFGAVLVVAFAVVIGLGIVPAYKTLFIWQMLVIVSVSIALVLATISSFRGNGEAIVFVVGFVLFTASAGLAILSARNVIPRSIGQHFFFAGVIGLETAFGLIIANRYNQAQLKNRLFAADLQKKNEELAALDKLKDQFLANTSHELRTPLVGILGIAESLIAGAAGMLGEKVVSNLRLITQSGYRLSKLINDILDFSQIKEAKLELALEAVDVKKVAELVQAMSTPLISRKDIVLEVALQGDLSPVKADPNRLQQILYNLIGNAIKFTEHGQVTLSARELGTEVELCVSDTGIGIAAANDEEVFKSFEQGDASTTRKFGGTGLGLSVTKQLVELQGGRIWLESEPGKGSRFFFTLPRTTEPPKQQESEPLVRTAYIEGTMIPVPKESVASGSSKDQQKAADATILIVDDEEVNRVVLRNQLSLRNYRLLEAADGDEALALIARDGPPDLILLDVMMPNKSGYVVCRELRETYSANDLPIVFITAKNQLSNLIEGFDSGGNDYLAKPFLFNELLARVDTQLKLARTSRALGRAYARAEALLEATEAMQKADDLVLIVGECASHILRCLQPDFKGSSLCFTYLRRGFSQGAVNRANFSICSKDFEQGSTEHEISVGHHVVRDIQLLEDGKEPAIRRREWYSEPHSLVVPLWDRDEPFGLMELRVSLPQELSPEDVHFLNSMQQHLGLTLRSWARLSESVSAAVRRIST